MALDGLMGKGSSSTLTKYEGKGDQDLVDEQIDDVILRLLGLDDVFDIDYGTYKTLLKERLAAARMSTSKIPSEEDQLIVEEYKRVKSKTGRFKVKKKKITSKSFSSSIKSTAITLQRKPLLISPTSQIKKEGDIDKIKDDTSNPFIVINKKLDSILSVLSQQLNLQKKLSEDEKKKNENLKRQKREESLEKGFKIVKDIVQKALKPFQSIFDRIWRFISFVLLGRAFLGLMKWLENPQNQKRIETLVRFLKDWWPSLALAAGLFLTPFGKFIRTTIGLLTSLGSQIFKLIAAHPLIFGTAALTAGGAVAGTYLESRLRGVDETLLERKVQESKDKGKPLSQQEIEKIKLEQLQKRVQDVTGTNIPGSALSVGGKVPSFSGIVGKDSGMSVSGFGKDTQAFPVDGGGSAILQPGETVLQVGARERMIENTGIDPLAYNVGPNANKPKQFNKSLLRSSGGIIGFNRGGVIGMQGGGTISAENLEKIYIQGQKSGMNSEVLKAIGDEAFLLRNFGVGGTWRHFKGSGASNMRGEPLQIKQGGGLVGGLDSFGRSIFENVGGSVGKTRGRDTGIPGGGWFGEKYGQRKGRKIYDQLTSPLRRQGGGPINRGSTADLELRIDKMINQGLPQTLSDYNRQVEQGQSQPINPQTFQQELEKQRYNAKMRMLRNYLLYQQSIQQKTSGGLIKENTGMNIFGATADRQLTALQPGEYVLPVDTVSRLGTSFIDKLVALTDSNSTPAKLGKRSVNRTIPGPLSRNRGAGTMTLPPIMSGAGGGSIGSGNVQMNNSQVSLFDITPPTSIEQRSINAKIYGLAG